MSLAEVERAVGQILIDSLGVEPDRIRPEADLAQGLGLDSLDRIELVFELEAHFHLEIPDAEIAAVRTVRDISERLAAALAAPGPGGSEAPG